MAELQVSRKNISSLFTGVQNNKFEIPDYQRPYKWDLEKCETLWDDVVHFKRTKKSDEEEYFLGTIVSVKKDNGDIEVIDGQQRITSFILLLRAFYRKLEEMDPSDVQVAGLKSQVAPCIWDIDPVSQQVSDKTKIHVESLVATEQDNETFHDILIDGNTSDSKNDNYSNNYRFFYHKCSEFAREHPMDWKMLCVTILNKCIVLPIECKSSDTALTIFSTLNDRGMPLSDSDIFKAGIYRAQGTPEEKKIFADTWKELTVICENAHISLNDLFRYYSHVLRARTRDKSKEIGLRRFYKEHSDELSSENLLGDLMRLARFWRHLYTWENWGDLSFELSFESKKYLHCLYHYPNEFWKFITSVYFFHNHSKPNFEIGFSEFLKKLTVFLFVKFIERPTVNAIKDDIYQRCISIYHDEDLGFYLSIERERLIERLGEFSSSRLTRALLLLHAYINENQKELVPENFEIEHIFPRKWQETNYKGWSREAANIYIEKLGNKVIIEKKLNIQAGNDYFGNKKLKYSGSKISNVVDLSNRPGNDWIIDDIILREEAFKKDLVDHFVEVLI